MNKKVYMTFVARLLNKSRLIGIVISFLDCDLCELLDDRIIRAIEGLYLFGSITWLNLCWQNT